MKVTHFKNNRLWALILFSSKILRHYFFLDYPSKSNSFIGSNVCFNWFRIRNARFFSNFEPFLKDSVSFLSGNVFHLLNESMNPPAVVYINRPKNLDYTLDNLAFYANRNRINLNCAWLLFFAKLLNKSKSYFRFSAVKESWIPRI